MSDIPPRARSGPEGWIAAALLFCILAVITLQIVSRNSDWIQAPVWTEELSRWFWIWMVFVGMAECERADGHLKMGLLPARLPPKWRNLLFLFLDILVLVVFIDLVRIGYNGAVRGLNAMPVTLPVPMAVLYAAFPLAGVLMIVRIGLRIVRRIGALRRPSAGALP